MFVKLLILLINTSLILARATDTNGTKSLTDLLSDNKNSNQEPSLSKMDGDSYLLKYLTPYTEYPTRLIDYNDASDSSTKWFKFGSDCYIDELDKSDKYFTTEYDSNGAINLLILSYDRKTNFLLDHYEPKNPNSKAKSKAEKKPGNEVYDDGDYDDAHGRSIYTIAYLNTFELIVNEMENDMSEIMCKANVLVPNGLVAEHNDILQERIEETAFLKLKMPDRHKFMNHKTLNKEIVNDLGKTVRVDSSKRNNSVEVKAQAKTNMSKNSFEPTLIEIEIYDGPFYVYPENLLENSTVTISCQLILKDFDKSHAFDSAIYKTITKNKNPPMGSNISGANSSSLSMFKFSLFNFSLFIMLNLLSFFVSF